MTIKRQLFFSNIRTVIIAIVAFVLVSRLITFFILGTEMSTQEVIDMFLDLTSQNMQFLRWVIPINIFLAFVSIINGFFSHRMTKKITKPLEPLNEGVRQIHDNNLAYRIDYQNNDEFRPVCDAFDEMAEKLEASTVQREKDEANRRELIAGISHDLRTPLTSIIGCIEGIETGVASTPEKQKKYLAYIKSEAVNMKYNIQQLFLFSKLDMDEFPLDLMRIDICLAVSEIIEDSLAAYESRGLSIHLSAMPTDLYVSADVRLLHNVVNNILGNSVKYKTKEHGKIEINATVLNDHIMLYFADDGPGVEAEMLPKLLDVFYRTDPSRNKAGSGLGLAISAKIIHRMGGNIHAELPSSGGLAIIVALPLLQ